jgi:hypothetical protein
MGACCVGFALGSPPQGGGNYDEVIDQALREYKEHVEKQ